MSTKKVVTPVKAADAAASRRPQARAPAIPPQSLAADRYVQLGYLVTSEQRVTIRDFQASSNLGNGTIKLPPRGPGPAPSRTFAKVFEIDDAGASVIVEVAIRFRPR